MLNERTINVLESLHVPNTYWENKSDEYWYWFRALYERLTSTVEWTIPETWDRHFFNVCVYFFDVFPVFKTSRWGVTFMNAHPVGYSWYYEPTHMQVCNPKLTKKFEIGKDCELIRLTNDGHGCYDILDHYAGLLAEASQSVNVALQNAKMPIVLTASNVAQAETLKKVYDKMKQGESLIVYDNTEQLVSDEVIPTGDEPFQSFINDLKNNYLGTEILENIDKILNQFYQEVGIETSENTSHGKSHTLEIEAEQSNSQTQARLDTWMRNLKDSCDKVNAMFGIGLEVKKRECENSISSDDQRDGSLESSDQ